MSKQIMKSNSDRVFDIVNYSFLTIILIIVLYPLIFIISASFSHPSAVMSGRVWLFPVDFNLMGYKAVFRHKQVLTGYSNSLYYTIVGTTIQLAVTIMAAYPLSRKDKIFGKGVVMFFFTFTMLFGGGMIPNFLLVRALGLYNTRWALLIPGALGVWNMIITKTFFQSNIPDELYDAASIDGSGEIRTLFSIVLPLSGTIIAVNSLFYAVGKWNAYFNALLYLRDAKLFPLQIFLRNILVINQVDSSMIEDVRDIAERQGLTELLKYSLIIVASLPVMLAYPFVQKYFVKGVMVGSIKG